MGKKGENERFIKERLEVECNIAFSKINGTVIIKVK